MKDFEKEIGQEIRDADEQLRTLGDHVHNLVFETVVANRGFVQNLLIVVGALLGSLFLLDTQISRAPALFNIGVILLICFEVFVILLLREALDKDFNSFKKVEKVFLGAIREKRNLAKEYLEEIRNSSEEDREKIYTEYRLEGVGITEGKDFKELYSKLDRNNYPAINGEILTFLLLSGVFLIALSFLYPNASGSKEFFIVFFLCIFFVTFLNTASTISSFLSFLIFFPIYKLKDKLKGKV